MSITIAYLFIQKSLYLNKLANYHNNLYINGEKNLTISFVMIIPISAGIALDDRIDTIEFSDKYAIFNFDLKLE